MRFLHAAFDLVERTGALSTQIRYSDDERPTVWIALAEYMRADAPAWKLGAGLTPVAAAMALLDDVIDGGTCQHCQRPTGVTADHVGAMPLDELVCWYRFDPELATFRRSCEGVSS